MDVIPKIRKLSQEQRVQFVEELTKHKELEHLLRPNDEIARISDLMIENSLGTFPIPLGLASDFLIDGKQVLLPMATEEPSVIAAASFAALTLSKHGGFITEADKALIPSTVYVEFADEKAAQNFVVSLGPSLVVEMTNCLENALAGMKSRGGGLQDISFSLVDKGLVKIRLLIDVVDAMGANLANTCAELLRPIVEANSSGKILLAILSNYMPERCIRAQFSIPVVKLARGSFNGLETAQRICKCADIAQIDIERAVTHNKGIMNGISAFALACGNDTRALEAGVHAWACRKGTYQGLSRYSIVDDSGVTKLFAEIEIPLAFGSVGGSTKIHPLVQVSFAILDSPCGSQLARYAAALGLAQNFAALWALSTEGIQSGHMKLHERKNALGSVPKP